jgi:hypothetical protein
MKTKEQFVSQLMMMVGWSYDTNGAFSRFYDDTMEGWVKQERDPVQAFHEDLAELVQKYLPHDREFPTEPAMELISQTLHGVSAFGKAES